MSNQKIKQEDYLPVYQSVEPYDDDEFDLVDIWHFLWRRKGWILLTLLAVVILSLILYKTTPPVYESSATMRVGQILDQKGDIVMLASASDLMTDLTSKYGQVDVNGEKRPLPYLANVALVRGTENTLALSAQAGTPEVAREFVDSIIAKAVADHMEMYDSHSQKQNAYETELNEQAHGLSDQIKQNTVFIEKLEESDPLQASLLIKEKGVLITQLNGIEQMLHNLAMRKSEILVYPSFIVQESKLPEEPIRPKLRRSLVLGVLGGLILGIIVALLVELIHATRRRYRNQAVTRDSGHLLS